MNIHLQRRQHDSGRRRKVRCQRKSGGRGYGDGCSHGAQKIKTREDSAWQMVSRYIRRRNGEIKTTISRRDYGQMRSIVPSQDIDSHIWLACETISYWNTSTVMGWGYLKALLGEPAHYTMHIA
jgi:ribosomal protein L19E